MKFKSIAARRQPSIAQGGLIGEKGYSTNSFSNCFQSSVERRQKNLSRLDNQSLQLTAASLAPSKIAPSMIMPDFIRSGHISYENESILNTKENNEDRSSNLSEKRKPIMKDNYRDHSDLLIPPDTRRVGRGCISNPFPNMLHAILIASESEGTMDIVSWRPHGRAFRIHKRDAFCEQILPQYFKQSKITSFQRQLNLYGFLRISRGPDAGAYYHEYFLRGRKELCVHIRRTNKRDAHQGDAESRRRTQLLSHALRRVAGRNGRQS